MNPARKNRGMHVYENDLCQQISFRGRAIRFSVRSKGSVLAQPCYRGFVVTQALGDIFERKRAGNISSQQGISIRNG